MDDPRISRMYFSMVQGWFSTLHDRIWRRGVMRSGMMTGLVLALTLAGLTVAYREHMRGNFHKLKAKIATDRQDLPVLRPGGQEPLVLTRTRLTVDAAPEFLSATLLPGRGMNLLQITAYIPGKGEVNLMDSPPIEAATSAMTGTGADAGGQASLAMGGAFEVPWADGIWGTSSAAGGRSTTTWRGHVLSLPSIGSGGGAASSGGLLLRAPATVASTRALPDGGEADATFEPGDFGAHWPSRTELTVTALLSSRTLELTMVARNTGDVAEPIGIGWHPRFAILEGNREQLRLRVSGDMRTERDGQGAPPTGRLIPVTGTPHDFTPRSGARLGTMGLDECIVALRQDSVDSGPVAELTDPSNNYGLRLMALSPTIKAIHVVAPAGAPFVSIDPQFNYPDPFGREWAKEANTGIVVLQPGQSTEWKVRLELFALSGSESGK